MNHLHFNTRFLLGVALASVADCLFSVGGVFSHAAHKVTRR